MQFIGIIILIICEWHKILSTINILEHNDRKKLLTIGMLITMFANDSYICAAYKRTAPVAINPLKTRRKIKKIKKRNKHIKVETRAPTFGEIVMTASFCLLGACGGAFVFIIPMKIHLARR